MFFSERDYEKIIAYIVDHSKKDTEFEQTYTIDGQELIPLIQDGVNKNIQVSELIRLLDDAGIEVRVLQDEGESVSMVMSQKAVTDALNSIRSTLTNEIDNVLDIIDLDAEKGTVQQQIDNIDSRLNETDNDIISLREETERLDDRIDTISDTVDDINSNISRFDTEISTINTNIDTINNHIDGPSSTSIQSQINSINAHIGAPTSQSIQSQINSINGIIGPISGTIKDSIDDLNQNINRIETDVQQLDGSINRLDDNISSLQSGKLAKGLDNQGGDLIDNLLSTKIDKALTANQGRVLQTNITRAQDILQGNIDEVQRAVDTFVHTTIVDRGMAVSVSGQRLNLEFSASSLNTIYAQQVGNVLSLTNATLQ